MKDPVDAAFLAEVRERERQERAAIEAPLRNLIGRLERERDMLQGALKKAYREINEIHARDGVPYTHEGIKASVDERYFASVVHQCRAALAAIEGRSETPTAGCVSFSWVGKPCAKCGEPVYMPTNRYMQPAVVMGDKTWHGWCAPSNYEPPSTFSSQEKS